MAELGRADLDGAHVRQVAPRAVRPRLGRVQVRLAAAATRRQALDLLPGRLLRRLVVCGLQRACGFQWSRTSGAHEQHAAHCSKYSSSVRVGRSLTQNQQIRGALGGNHTPPAKQPSASRQAWRACDAVNQPHRGNHRSCVAIAVHWVAIGPHERLSPPRKATRRGMTLLRGLAAPERCRRTRPPCPWRRHRPRPPCAAPRPRSCQPRRRSRRPRPWPRRRPRRPCPWPARRSPQPAPGMATQICTFADIERVRPITAETSAYISTRGKPPTLQSRAAIHSRSAPSIGCVPLLKAHSHTA